jgi:hypothetical protein
MVTSDQINVLLYRKVFVLQPAPLGERRFRGVLAWSKYRKNCVIVYDHDDLYSFNIDDLVDLDGIVFRPNGYLCPKCLIDGLNRKYNCGWRLWVNDFAAKIRKIFYTYRRL